MRAAEAEKHAAALEASAATLREAGLEEQAAAQEKEAAQRRKQAALPSDGKRLDLLKAFVARCEKRAEKSEEAVLAAQGALEDALVDRDEAEAELKAAEAQLATLRLSGATGAEPESKRGRWGDADAPADATAATEELQRTQQRLAEEQRLHADLKRRTAKPVELEGLGAQELRQRLEAAAAAYTTAVQEGRWGDATRLCLQQGHLTAALRELPMGEQELHEHWRGA